MVLNNKNNKLNIGCDLVYIPRFKKALQNEKFVSKVFQNPEQIYCNQKKDSAASYAVRFAAKEAFAKALGTGLLAPESGISLKDIWIENEPNGKPQLKVSTKLQIWLTNQNVTDWDISLSHHGHYAMATAVVSKAE